MLASKECSDGSSMIVTESGRRDEGYLVDPITRGARVNTAVGTVVGIGVGKEVGSVIGIREGGLVGFVVATADGNGLGTLVDLVEGIEVGKWEGAGFGCSKDTPDGLLLG